MGRFMNRPNEQTAGMCRMDLSVIIPCFNSQNFLKDALDSVHGSENLSRYSYEVLIINDGSTHPGMLELLDRLDHPSYRIFHQSNQGPAAARNKGIGEARGEFLLLLDSDNKVLPHFIDRAISTLRETGADIFYGQPTFFGETTTPRFAARPFDPNKLLLGNFIDTCSVLRKSVWDDLGGFDETPILIGHEDWDFWLRAAKASRQFYFVDEPMYAYRISRNSLIMQKNAPAHVQHVHKYVYGKNLDLIIQSFQKLAVERDMYEHDQQYPVRSLIKFVFRKMKRTKYLGVLMSRFSATQPGLFQFPGQNKKPQ